MVRERGLAEPAVALRGDDAPSRRVSRQLKPVYRASSSSSGVRVSVCHCLRTLPMTAVCSVGATGDSPRRDTEPDVSADGTRKGSTPNAAARRRVDF